jgi:uncharacterized MAPEG superfamily protein
MTIELTMLAWTLVLALVQVFLPVGSKTIVWGSKWNAGPRDEQPSAPLPPVTGRLDRAQANLYETLPLFIAAVLIAHVADRNSIYTAFGAQLYFWARVAYVPLYALGVPYVRSLAFVACIIGLAMILLSIFGVV